MWHVWKDYFSKGIIAVFSLLAAVFWFWSAMVEIPSNLDTFIEEIQWAAELSGYGALSASVAALFGFINFVREWHT